MDVSGRSSVGSAANAICNHIRDLFLGSDKPVSMGIYSSHKLYDIPEDLIFSVPCHVTGKGEYKVHDSWVLADLTKEWIQKNVKELQDEFALAQEFL